MVMRYVPSTVHISRLVEQLVQLMGKYNIENSTGKTTNQDKHQS